VTAERSSEASPEKRPEKSATASMQWPPKPLHHKLVTAPERDISLMPRKFSNIYIKSQVRRQRSRPMISTTQPQTGSPNLIQDIRTGHTEIPAGLNNFGIPRSYFPLRPEGGESMIPTVKAVIRRISQQTWSSREALGCGPCLAISAYIAPAKILCIGRAKEQTAQAGLALHFEELCCMDC
jgi:hypothetical protein